MTGFQSKRLMARARLEALYESPSKGLRDEIEISRLEKELEDTNVRIILSKLLGGWFIVRGPHQTPIGGRFNSREEAQAFLDNKKAG